MRLAGSVTSFASLVLHATVIERRLPVRAVVIGLRDVVVTAAAGIGTGIKGGIGRITDEFLVLHLLSVGLLIRSGVFVRMLS